jgi:GNAT superfamily N-acetyltransferase
VNVSVEALVPSDVEAVCSLAREIWREHYPPIIGTAQTEYMLEQRYSPSSVRDELAEGRIWWDVLREDGAIVAFASAYAVEESDEVKLDKLYVRAHCRRKGYGGMLIARTAERARQLGCTKLMLAVNKHNSASIEAYRKHGFSVREAIVKDIGGGFVMDDFIMEKSIA